MPRLRGALDAVTAAVVGLIAATAWTLARQGLVTVAAWVVFGACLLLCWRWRRGLATPATILLGGLLGALLLA